jgi:hypothetical protein
MLVPVAYSLRSTGLFNILIPSISTPTRSPFMKKNGRVAFTADSLRCANGNDVTRFQRQQLTDLRDRFRHGKDHVARVASLQSLTADAVGKIIGLVGLFRCCDIFQRASERLN